MTTKLAKVPLLFTLVLVAAWAQVNIGEQKPEASLPFTMTTVATFNLPWRLAFLPDGRLLITEKVGPVWLVSQQGEKIQVGNTPKVYHSGQSGMHGVFLSPHYATDHSIYLTYAEPGDYGGGLALARAKLNVTATSATLENFAVLWRQTPTGKGGQEGAQAHDPSPGSRPARRQDPATDAGRQTRARQPQLRQNRRCLDSSHRSAD
jgi:aldose sugar dehydrogenase